MNLGGLLANNGDFDEAMVHFQRSIELEPDSDGPYIDMAVALSQQGKTDEAIANFRKALEADPNLGPRTSNLAILLAERDDVDEAIVHFRRAIEIDPDVVLPYSPDSSIAPQARKDDRGRQV